jgi:antibiotic biosynthesis monooxygenase (ABM) superfamily enzyme
MLRVPLLSLCKPKVWKLNSLSLYMQSLIYTSFEEPKLNFLHVMLAGVIGVVVGYSTWDSWMVLPCLSHALCLCFEL